MRQLGFRKDDRFPKSKEATSFNTKPQFNIANWFGSPIT